MKSCKWSTKGVLFGIGLALSFYNAGYSAEPIKFGVSTAISGDQAASGKPFLQAITMMADLFNEQGGILGRPVKVVYYDDKGIPDQALQICKKLVFEDKVQTLQPGSSSGCIMTGMAAGKEGKVAMWGYGLVKDWLLQGNGMIFRSACPDDATLPALAQFAVQKLHVKNVGVLYLDTFAGESTKNTFVKWFTRLGGRVSKITPYTEGDRDFSSQFMALAGDKPDAVFMEVQSGACAPALRQLRQFMPKEVQVLAEISWLSTNIRKEAGDIVNGIYYFAHPAVSVNPDPEVQKWINMAKAKLGFYDEIMARAIVGMSVMKEAITRAKTTDAVAVMKEVHKMKDFPTVMGPFTYDPRDGEGLKRGIVVTPTGGADLSKDKVVFSHTTKEPLYDKVIDYTPYFGKDYYAQLLKVHGLQ